ncbi:hypothetical protein EYF80_047063 [Liparis tanakae]|uniref:Uncharacterized protein n=1 Tax=Liparis tanakae TaxID=230148 RepID=A0A4Z2FNB9_9TELE|nr:hypothetical protein EYF80_047063 [Liparis tanakae]
MSVTDSFRGFPAEHPQHPRSSNGMHHRVPHTTDCFNQDAIELLTLGSSRLREEVMQGRKQKATAKMTVLW